MSNCFKILFFSHIYIANKISEVPYWWNKSCVVWCNIVLRFPLRSTCWFPSLLEASGMCACGFCPFFEEKNYYLILVMHWVAYRKEVKLCSDYQLYWLMWLSRLLVFLLYFLWLEHSNYWLHSTGVSTPTSAARNGNRQVWIRLAAAHFTNWLGTDYLSYWQVLCIGPRPRMMKPYTALCL